MEIWQHLGVIGKCSFNEQTVGYFSDPSSSVCCDILQSRQTVGIHICTGILVICQLVFEIGLQIIVLHSVFVFLNGMTWYILVLNDLIVGKGGRGGGII